MDALRELDGGRRAAEDEWGDTPTGVQVKSDGTVRYCRKCATFKPDRAHHCSSCGYCVLKMDHHCPWLGGGCGWANYKFFLLFLWYSGALGLFVAATTLLELIAFVSEDPNNFELAPIAWALVFFLGVIFGLSIGLFGSYHFYLAARNRTTLENMEGAGSVLPSSSRDPHAHFRPNHALSRRERWKLEKANSNFNIYDHGVKANLAQIFGGWESRWIWLLPVGWPPGDGTSFPVDREKLTKLRQITAEIRLGRGRDEEEAPSGWDDPRAIRRA
ncbi:DHHC palmitoyltransferase-domain-containing protein [Leucosporidium creatinivorum]|uniref:Palmitoyltransferase n=1 Tax=Leucosporidium creatinivorum TaxID=106004 RepID=A0A1Y2EXD8_9BASI|nr:DHHC palmitoyltransferase-domain-containing protein [Leucosporidium creatinivorum]